MNSAYELNYLSDSFYDKYNHKDYPEIEIKRERPYMVLLVKIDFNTFAIPFRTNVKHSYCYRFKNSNRDTDTVTALDFTKAVVVNDEKYIGNAATIDNKEYIELSRKYYFIISKFRKYLDGYNKYVDGKLNEYDAKKYKYTTLKYFNVELKSNKLDTDYAIINSEV